MGTGTFELALPGSATAPQDAALRRHRRSASLALLWAGLALLGWAGWRGGLLLAGREGGAPAHVFTAFGAAALLLLASSLAVDDGLTGEAARAARRLAWFVYATLALSAALSFASAWLAS